MLILVTWRWRTQTERVWQSSVVNTSTTSCCHQRHTHEPVGGDRLSHRMNIGPTITVYLKMPDKNSSLSQILRCCAQWEHTLDSLQAQIGSDTRRPTTRQHHRPTPIDAAACSYHVGSCMVVMCMKNTRRYTPSKHEAFTQFCFKWSTVFDAGPTLKHHRVNSSCCWAGSSSPGARYRQSVPQGGNLPTVMTVGPPSCR